MRQSTMENNYLPPADCNLHENQGWEVKHTLVVCTYPLLPIEKGMYVHVNIQVQFKFDQHTRVLLQPLTPNLIPLLIQTAKEF